MNSPEYLGLPVMGLPAFVISNIHDNVCKKEHKLVECPIGKEIIEDMRTGRDVRDEWRPEIFALIEKYK